MKFADRYRSRWFLVSLLSAGVLAGPATPNATQAEPLAGATVPTATDTTSGSALPFEMSERQRGAIARMPSVEVDYHQKGTVRLIEGITGITVSRSTRGLSKGGSGKDVLTTLRDVLLVSGD